MKYNKNIVQLKTMQVILIYYWKTIPIKNYKE